MKSFILNKNTNDSEIESKISEIIKSELNLGCQACGICIFTYSENQENTEVLILADNDLCMMEDIIGSENIFEGIENLKHLICKIRDLIKEDKQIKINFKNYSK